MRNDRSNRCQRENGDGDKGGGVRGNSKRVGVRFWDAEEEEEEVEEEGGVVMVVVISCSVLENNAQNFDGNK